MKSIDVMRKRKNTGIPADKVGEIELTQELERIVNENNALLKVLKKITGDVTGSEKKSDCVNKGNDSKK